MKKFLFSALAVVVTLFATNSCVREPNYIEDPSQAVTVSYSVTLDQVQKTKTTLAELDDIAVDKLFYSVYQLTGTNTYTAIDHSDYHKAVDLSATGTADVTVKLIKGETYKVVFWAQKGTAYVSTIDKDHPLGEITIDYTASDSYAADRDAFTAFDVITLDSTTPGTDYSSTFSKEIHLKRPFAQINFGADDVAQAAVQGYVAYSSVVAVKQAASKFNVTTGEASTPVDATFKSTVLPEVAVKFDINNVTYQRVAKAFVLPTGTFEVTNDGTAGTITSPLSTTPEVSLTLTVKKGENSLVLDPRTKSNVTVRSNYRTNLLGHLITTDATFQVVVDNDYEGSTDHVSIVSLGNASGNNEITMGDAEGISSDINFGEHPVILNNTLTINGDVTISNGASLTVNAAIEVAEGATLTLDNVTIDNASTAPQIMVSKGATLIINGGTYTATDVDQLFNLLTSTISPAKIGRRDNSTKGELIIRGGTFMGDPTAYVDTDHYTVTDNNDGTFTVAQKPVTLTVEAGDVSMKMGDAAVLKTLTVDPADTDLSGISFEYSVANVASASYDPTSGKISVNAVGVGSTVVTVKVGTATATINVTVLPADSILLSTNTLSVAKNATSDNITVTLNNDATVTEVVSDDPTKVKVNWESGNTFTVTGLAVTAEAVNVTVHASNALSATVAVSVYQPDAEKLAAPTLMATGVTKTDDEIELDWAPVEHASGYAVTVGQTALDGSKITTKANGDISADIEGLSPATEYVIKVVAVGDGVDYANSDEASITVTTEKGDVTIEVAQANSSYSIVKGLTATITGVSVKYAGSVIDVPVTYTLGTGASGKVTVEGTTITAVDVVDGARINVVFAGNDTYNASTATDAIIVEVTEPVLESISLNSDELTVKKTFELNEAFTHENLVVTAHYNNNTTADVTAGATFSEVDMTTAGQKTVTVSYGGKSATYTITVNAAVTLSSVAITHAATKTTFTEGEAFDATGLELTGTYSNNSTQVLTPSFKIGDDVVTSGVTLLSGVGQKTVTVYSAEDATKTDSYNIIVEAAPAAAKTIAEIKALIPSSEATIDGTFAIDAVVTGVYGETTKQNVFIEDNTGGILIYGCSLNVTAGKKIQGEISGLKGKKFSGLNEITAITIADGAIKDGGTVTETVVTLAQIAENMDTYVSRRVKVENVTFTEAMPKAKNSSVTINGVKIFVSSELPDAVATNTVNDLVGYPCPYNTTNELTLWGEGAVTYKSTVLGPATISGVPGSLTLKAGATYNFIEEGATVSPNGAALNFEVTSGNGTITPAGVLSVNSNASNGDEIVVTVTAPAVDNVCLAATPVTCTVTVSDETLANVTIDFSAQGYENAQDFSSLTVTPIHVTADKGTNSNGPKYYTNGTGVKVYGGGTLTVSSSKTIKSIAITGTANKTDNTLTPDSGSIANSIWTGSATSIEFAIGGSSGNYQFKTLVVTYVDDGVVETVTLESIAVNGQKLSFKQGDEFEFGGTVTATYSDASTKNVTANASFTGYNMSTISESQTVTVSYTENEVTKTTSYTIAITDPNAATDYSTTYTTSSEVTVTQESKVVIGGTQYDASKIAKGGSISITVPSGTSKLHLFIAAWNKEGADVTITGGTIDNATITADTGVANNSPFTLAGTISDYYRVITLTNNTTTSVTIQAANNKRAVVWGVNPE